jgi:hypothetical protein
MSIGGAEKSQTQLGDEEEEEEEEPTSFLHRTFSSNGFSSCSDQH